MANTPSSVGHYRARNARSAIRSSAQSTSASVTRNAAPTPLTLEDSQRHHQAQILLLQQQRQQQVQQQSQHLQQPQFHIQQYQLPAVAYPHTQPAPQANSDDVINVIRRFYDRIDPRMQKQDDNYKRLDAKIDLLLAEREEAKIVEARQAKILEAKLAVHRDLVEFLKRLEKTIGRSADNNPNFSIMGRLDALDFSVGELLERARDPEANFPDAVAASVPAPPVRHEMGVSPRKKAYANASTIIDLSSPGPSTPRQFTAVETSSLCTRCSSDNMTVVGDTTMFDLTKQVQAFNDKSPRNITLDLYSSRDNIPPVEPSRRRSPFSSGSRTQSCEANSRSNNSQDFSPANWSQTTSSTDQAISTSTPKKIYPVVFHPSPIAHSKSSADVPEEGTIASLRLQTLGDRECLEPSNTTAHQLEASPAPPAHPSMHSPADSMSPGLGDNEEDANKVDITEDEDEQMVDRDQQLLDEKDQAEIDNEDKEERSSSSTASEIAITANHHPAPSTSLIFPSSDIPQSLDRSPAYHEPPTRSPNSTPKQKYSLSLPSPDFSHLAQRSPSFSSPRTSQPLSSTPKRKSSPIKPEYMSSNHASLAQRSSCSSPSTSTRTPQLSSSVEDEQVVSELVLASPTPTPIPNTPVPHTQRAALSQQPSLRLPSPPPSSPWAWASQQSTPRGHTALPVPPGGTSSSSSFCSPNKVGRSFADRPSNERPSMTITPQSLHFAYSSSSLSSVPNNEEEDEEEVVIASSCSPPPIESQQEYEPRAGAGDHGIDRTQQDEHGNEKNLVNGFEIEGQDHKSDEENANNLFALPTPEFESSPERGGGPDVSALDDETEQHPPHHGSSSQSPPPTPSSLHPTSKIRNVASTAQPPQTSHSPPRFPSVTSSPPAQDSQVTAASPEKPRQIHVPPKPPHTSREAMYISSSPELQPEVKSESHHSPSRSFAESLSPLTDEESDSSLRARGFKPRYDDSDDAEIVPVKKRKITPTKKKIEPGRIVINLKALLSKPGDSAAATKVVRKKRKVMVDNEDEEPPLKRAKDRLSMKEKGKRVKKDGSTASLGTVKQEQKPKKKRLDGVVERDRSPSASEQRSARPRRGKRKVKWPALNELGDNGFHRKFIKCDLCFAWFHYGCVGITPTDSRLNPTEMFFCPPCDANGSSQKREGDTEATFCGRPDCDHREAPADEYFVAGIVGRKIIMTGGHGRLSKWLVKWDGYPINQCTWEYENAMPDPQKLIEEFEEAATKEGIDLDADPYARVLLREVIEGGWSDPEEE